jgi:hypothetical protein
MFPERFYSKQNEEPEKKVISNVPIININNKNLNTNTNSNQYSSGASLVKSPGKFYNSTNNAYSQSN